MSGDVGTIKGTIGLDASGVVKGVDSAIDSVESFAKHAKKMATDFAVVGAGITASVIGIVSKVQTVSPAAHAAFEGFTNATETLGIQIAKIVVPALAEMGRMLRDIANYLAGLSPATKQHIADWVVIAAQVGAAAIVFGRMMELLKGLAMLFSGLTAVIGAIGTGPLLVLVAGVAVLGTVIAIVHKAWRENWNGMRDAVSDALGSMLPALTNFGSMLKTYVLDVLDNLVTTIARLSAMAGALVGSLQAGADVATTVANVKDAAGQNDQSYKYGGKGGASQVVSDVSDKVQGVAKNVIGEWALMTKDIRSTIGAFLKEHGLDFSSHGAVAESPANPEARAAALAGAAEQRALALADNQRAIEQARQQRDYNNIGRSQGSVMGQKTDSFADFNDALKQEAAALRSQEQLLSAAKMMELRASQLAATQDDKAAAAALDSAEQMKLLAQNAGETADKAKEAAAAFVELKNTPSKFAEALKLGADMMTKNLGELGTVINDVVKGWQQGGIWGALIAFVMDLLSMVDGWKDIQAIANGQLKMALKDMAQGLGSLISAIKPVMGAIESIASAVHGILNPILNLVGKLLAGIAPVLEMVGLLLSSLAPIIDLICNLLGTILTPIFKVLSPILMAITETFLFMKLTIEYTILGLYMFLDALEKLGGGSDQGDVNKTQADIDATKQQMIDLANNGLEGLANNSANAAEQLGKTADAAASVTQQLLNVPDGIKVALLAFNATAPTSRSGSTSSTMPGSGARAQFLNTGVTVRPGAYNRKKP